MAEIAPDPRDYPGMDPALAVPGSLVFSMTDTIVPLHDPSYWWAFVPGADWRHPTGPDSSIGEDRGSSGRAHLLRRHRSLCPMGGEITADRSRMGIRCAWRTGNSEFAWGNELAPEGKVLANYWEGVFPFATAQGRWRLSHNAGRLVPRPTGTGFPT